MILISLQRMQICHFLLFEGEVLSVCSLEQCVLISGKFKPVNTCSDGFEQSNCIKFGLYFYKSHHFLDFSCRAPVHCPHSKWYALDIFLQYWVYWSPNIVHFESLIILPVRSVCFVVGSIAKVFSLPDTVTWWISPKVSKEWTISPLPLSLLHM